MHIHSRIIGFNFATTHTKGITICTIIYETTNFPQNTFQEIVFVFMPCSTKATPPITVCGYNKSWLLIRWEHFLRKFFWGSPNSSYIYFHPFNMNKHILSLNVITYFIRHRMKKLNQKFIESNNNQNLTIINMSVYTAQCTIQHVSMKN